MATAKNITPAEDTKARSDLRTKGWIPINAKYGNKCAVCGTQIQIGSLISWHKTTSKVMHYNPCSLDFLANEPTTAAPAFPAPPTVSVGLGGKKPVRPALVTPGAQAPLPLPVPTPEPVKPPAKAEKKAEKKTETTTSEAAKPAKEKTNEPAKRKFGFVNIKLSDIKRG